MEKNGRRTNVPSLVGDGMKFDPTDKELLISYLLPKVANKPLPLEGYVLDCDLYSDQEPSTLFGDRGRGGGNVKYFFTKLTKKSSRDGTTRFDRTVGDGGTWKGIGGGKDICHKKVEFGYVKSFAYQKKKAKGQEQEQCLHRYLMKEYSLSTAVLKSLNKIFKGKVNNDIVLCRIKIKDMKRKRKRDESNDSDKDCWNSDNEADIEALLRELMKEYNYVPLQIVSPGGDSNSNNGIEGTGEVRSPFNVIGSSTTTTL